jgi:hypothetical protein
MLRFTCCMISLILLGLTPASQQQPDSQVRFDASTSRERQLELAASAAPAEVSSRATMYVLGSKGYEKAREGSNGFSCLVSRQYANTQEPECYDAEGSRTILLAHLRTEELRAQGKSEQAIEAEIDAGYKSGKFLAPSKPGIVYMMSGENWVFDPDAKKIIHFPGHLMFYAPYMTAKDLGYEKDASLPYLVHPGHADTLMIVVPQSRAKDSSDAKHPEHKN